MKSLPVRLAAGGGSLLILALAVVGCSVARQSRGVAPDRGVSATSAQSAAAPAEELSELPPPGPGLAPGTYRLTRASLPRPLLRDQVGILSPSTGGVHKGALFSLPGSPMVSLQVDRAAGWRTTLYVDRDGDRQPDNQPAAAGKPDHVPAAAQQGNCRIVFPPVKIGQQTLSLAAEVPPNPKGPIRIYKTDTDCLQAKIKSGHKLITLRVLGTGAQRTLWIDDDGDGVVAEWETVTLGGTVGYAGKLLKIEVDKPTKGSLTVSDGAKTVGAIVFDATDGNGKPGGVYNPIVSGSGGPIQYLGRVAVAQLPPGSYSIIYGLPITAHAMAQASIPRSVEVTAGKAVKIKAGGPVQLAVDAQPVPGGVQASISLTTATGHRITGTSGPGEAHGLVEVLGMNGDLLTSGPAEFG